MKEISDLVKIEEIKIPKTDIVIKLKTELSWHDQLEITKVKDLDELSMGKFLGARLIVDWNINDTEGNKLPITEGAISQLPVNVALPLWNKIFEIAATKEVKKKP